MVGVRRLLVGGVALPQDGDGVAVAGGDVAVQRVVADVRLTALEPVDLDRALAQVEVVDGADGVEGFLPVELARHVPEERLGIVDRLPIHRLVLVQGFDVSGGGEVGRGRVEVLLAGLGYLRRLRGDVVHGVHLALRGAKVGAWRLGVESATRIILASRGF